MTVHSTVTAFVTQSGRLCLGKLRWKLCIDSRVTKSSIPTINYHPERTSIRMETTAPAVDQVKSLIGEILGIADRVDSMDASTRLTGSLPELDSMAVVELLAAIEERFGFKVESPDIATGTFETIGTLAAYVEKNRP